MYKVVISEFPQDDAKSGIEIETLYMLKSQEIDPESKLPIYFCNHANGSFWIGPYDDADGYLGLLQACLKKYING